MRYEHTNLIDALQHAVETLADYNFTHVREQTANDEALDVMATMHKHVDDVAWLTDKLMQLSIDFRSTRK